MRCFASDEPTTRHRYLYLAEYWYNSTHHSSIGMSPFQALYGRPLPALPDYIAGSSTIASIDDTLLTHSWLLDQLKANLAASQARMTKSANKHRVAKDFQPGEWVYVKLRIYRQTSVANRQSHKLARRYFGPFKIAAKIGQVAYRLELLVGSRIHLVFHV